MKISIEVVDPKLDENKEYVLISKAFYEHLILCSKGLLGAVKGNLIKGAGPKKSNSIVK